MPQNTPTTPNNPNPFGISLFDRLISAQYGSPLSRANGATPPNIAETATSVLHYSFSINGNPGSGDGLDSRYDRAILVPSVLDRNDGATPPMYMDFRPQ